ncbi:uncharacterized protein Z518_00474 [Rhinocladiella mackenziei CBS 650.93]|uniref:Major facilitator superfamily (MFS) profile domain-containing protein n=1 Tax=Rhinocladiella mackenziei CBS 650.93 TaxID=1442369 RepID=A0A0D2JJ04_9EURO|nr:uncharacterized protein Z518_00474 [Rhinocladiella mackenziei CBS 650.93]KIX09395.1 hypothetical protein Z518_00474 [Rhinocladiella mackenziei CBS 650.93]
MTPSPAPSEKEKDLASIAHVNTVYPPNPIDPVLDARVRRKLDYRLLPILTLIYLFAFIDRSNAGNARVLGMGEDLQLDGYRFNIGLSGFYVTYILLEVPANILCKKVGPKVWIPFLAFSFGVITMCMSTVQNYQGFLAARICLGIFEAGIMPGITYTLSCFYCRHELVSRVGLYASVASLSGAFGGLLASGLTKIPQWGIIHSWRNIFFFEGIISIVLGVVGFIILPSSPETAYFLPEAERQVAITRINRDLKSQKVEELNMRYFKRALLNLNTILIALASFCSLLTMNSMALFVPSLLAAMGYSGIHSQLLSVPPYAWAACVCVTVTFLSDRTKRRGVWILIVMPFTATGFIILLTVHVVGVRYFALFLCLTGAFTASPMFVAWVVDNSAGHTTRAIVAATVVGFGNIGGILATWTYTLPDAPKYTKGHALNLGFACLCLVIVAAAIASLKRENNIKACGGRDDRVRGLTEDETADLGHLHPEFKFTL